MPVSIIYVSFHRYLVITSTRGISTALAQCYKQTSTICMLYVANYGEGGVVAVGYHAVLCLAFSFGPGEILSISDELLLPP
jgi:hypothetical protein